MKLILPLLASCAYVAQVTARPGRNYESPEKSTAEHVNSFFQLLGEKIYSEANTYYNTHKEAYQTKLDRVHKAIEKAVNNKTTSSNYKRGRVSQILINNAVGLGYDPQTLKAKLLENPDYIDSLIESYKNIPEARENIGQMNLEDARTYCENLENSAADDFYTKLAIQGCKVAFATIDGDAELKQQTGTTIDDIIQEVGPSFGQSLRNSWMNYWGQ